MLRKGIFWVHGFIVVNLAPAVHGTAAWGFFWSFTRQTFLKLAIWRLWFSTAPFFRNRRLFLLCKLRLIFWRLHIWARWETASRLVFERQRRELLLNTAIRLIFFWLSVLLSFILSQDILSSYLLIKSLGNWFILKTRYIVLILLPKVVKITIRIWLTYRILLKVALHGSFGEAWLEHSRHLRRFCCFLHFIVILLFLLDFIEVSKKLLIWEIHNFLSISIHIKVNTLWSFHLNFACCIRII